MQVSEINQIAASSDVLAAVSNVELFIVHCYVRNHDGCNIREVPPAEQESKELIELAPKISYRVVTVEAGAKLSKKMLSLALR